MIANVIFAGLKENIIPYEYYIAQIIQVPKIKLTDFYRKLQK